MTKLVAYLALFVALLLCTLGNFWFTYGIWPKSWWSYVGFGVLSLTIGLLIQAVQKEDSQ